MYNKKSPREMTDEELSEELKLYHSDEGETSELMAIAISRLLKKR